MNSKEISRFILAAEILALLHDIGKFTSSFILGNGNRTELHTRDFRKQENNLCHNNLLDILATQIKMCTPDNQNQIKALGDLQCWHHYLAGDLKNYFLKDKNKKLPLLLYLMMYADTIDSASSKGGAHFYAKGRSPRIDLGKGNQGKKFHIATPFGEEEISLYENDAVASERIDKQAADFQEELAEILKNFDPADYQKLLKVRGALIELMESDLAGGLAETRIPNNDVTLWQHSSSTAALFKAMLAGHLLNNNYDYCDKEGNLTHYKEKLAIIGFCWREDDLIARSFRAAEILGRRKRLDDAVGTIKEYLETELCLGNEIYRNRDGIYFLIPALTENIRPIFTKSEGDKDKKPFAELIDTILNGSNGLDGELHWQCRCQAIGQQITRLPEVMAGDKTEILASGPKTPSWLSDWQEKPRKAVCPRCGLRPVAMPMITSGSEGDAKENICSQCSKMQKEGGQYRNALKNGGVAIPSTKKKQRRRLTGGEEGCQYLTYDFDKLIENSGDSGGETGSRLALIQGLVDLRPFFSGTAFAAMLAAEPGRFSGNGGKKDKSCEMESWQKMLTCAKTAWDKWKKEKPDTKNLHTIQQIFHDSRMGTMDDGRADGNNAAEKGRNYLQDTVLKAPFPDHLKAEHDRLVNYALRKHPAPSRLARVWNDTLSFCIYPMAWCEMNKISYTTVSLDPGCFMILTAARHAENLLAAIYEEYSRRYGRVRHHLALHFSATVFYHKSPLYIAIDAARRFADIGLRRSRNYVWWKVCAIGEDDDRIDLKLETSRGRRVVFSYPGNLPNGNEDLFYPWFWEKDHPHHPQHISTLKKGDSIAVHPGSFDYEVLDSTTRRYDIRMERAGVGRPHSTCRSPGPRPYPLETIARWQRLQPILAGVETSQLKNMHELLARLHQDWNIPGTCDDGSAMKGVAADIVRNILGEAHWSKQGRVVHQMACDGSLFDLLEWYFLINK